MSAQPVDVLADLARIVALPVHSCDDARNAEGLQFAKRLATEARAAVAELIAERNRLANIVDSHEAQILRMTADMAELVEAATELLKSQSGPWERGSAYISARGAENMNAAMKKTRAALARMEPQS